MSANNPIISAARKAEARSHANLLKGRKAIRKPRLNHSKLPAVISLFLDGSTASNAATQTGVSKQAINRFIKSLRTSKPYTLHITDYVIVPGWILPVYTLGYGKDIALPKSLTQSERSKRYREKRKMLAMIQATAGSTKCQEPIQHPNQ